MSDWTDRQDMRRRMSEADQRNDANDWSEFDRVEELVASLRGLDASYAGYILWRASLDHPEDEDWLDKALIAVQTHREEEEEDEDEDEDPYEDEDAGETSGGNAGL